MKDAQSAITSSADALDSVDNGAPPAAVVDVAAAGVWGLSGRAILLVANIVATPFLIRLLGPSRYGLWAVLQTAVAWAVLADIGMATASTKLAADCYARHDNQGECSAVWTALSLTAITTCSVAIVIGIEAPTILSDVVHSRGALLSSGVVALRLVCALFLAQAIAGIVNTPQVVRLRWRQYTIVTTAANLITAIGAPMALAILSGGLVTVAAVGLCAAVFGAIGNLVLAVRTQPLLRRPCFDRVTMRRLVSYGGALAVSSLSSIPLTTAERFFLANNHSTAVVAYYGVAATVGTILYVLPAQLVQPLLPGLTRLENQGRLKEHRTLYHMSLAGLFLLLTPAAMMLAFLAHPFLSLWAGRVYGIQSTAPLLIIIVGVWFNCLAWVPTSYLLSSGRTRVLAYLELTQVGPYLFLAWILTEHYGVIGASIVWSGRLVLQSVTLFILVRRLAPHLPFHPLSERRWRAFIAPVALGCLLLATAIVTEGVTRWIAAGGLSTAYAVLIWRVVLTARERTVLLHLLEQLLDRSGSSWSAPITRTINRLVGRGR